MKNKILVSALTLLFLVLLGAWWVHKSSSTHEHSLMQTSASTKYICPMHPHITSDHSDSTCPICGMDLVPASEIEDGEDEEEGLNEEEGVGVEVEVEDEDELEGEGGNGNKDEDESLNGAEEDFNNKKENLGVRSSPQGRSSVRLSLDKQQMIGVKIQKAQTKPLFKSITSPGRVAFDPELYTAQSEYLEALKQGRQVQDSPIADVKANTQQMIQTSKIRLRVLGLSEENIQALARRGTQSESLLVGGQDHIVYAEVFEMDLPYIKVGQSAQITAGFLKNKVLPGKVISVDRVINPDSRTAKVRIELFKNESTIRPESYVNVTILAPLGEHLALPLDSILDTGVDTFVFVKKGEGRFEPIKIQVLLETDTDVAFVGDIKEGDPVVVGAQFLLDSESRLRSVIHSKPSSTEEHSH